MSQGLQSAYIYVIIYNNYNYIDFLLYLTGNKIQAATVPIDAKRAVCERKHIWKF